STSNGIWRYRNKTWTQYTTNNGLEDDQVNTIYEDGSGKIWAGIEGDNPLYYFSNPNWVAVNIGSRVKSINGICEGTDNKLYITGKDEWNYGDVFTYDGNNLKQLWLEYESYNRIIKGEDGHIYIS